MATGPEASYEHAIAVNHARRGPLRFEEGVATDTDIPNDFGCGAYGDTGATAAAVRSLSSRTRTRRCVSVPTSARATWIEAPTMLNDFVIGASRSARDRRSSRWSSAPSVG